MFTSRSNFTYGNYRIANIDVEEIDNNIDLTIHIQKYEQEALRMILGDCLYDELITNVEIDSETGLYKLKDGVDDKWDWLLNGRKYDSKEVSIFCGCHSSTCSKHQWDGLIRKVAKIQDKEIYESILASYIFFYWSLNYRTLNLGVGEGSGNAQNTTQESSSNKRVDAWNKFVQDVDYGYPNTKVSLNQFLNEHQQYFPEASLVCLKPMTYYDI